MSLVLCKKRKYWKPIAGFTIIAGFIAAFVWYLISIGSVIIMLIVLGSILGAAALLILAAHWISDLF